MNQSTTKLLTHFLGAYPGRSAAMIVLLVLAGLAEGFGVLTMLPILNAIMADGSSSEQDSVARIVTDVVEWVGLDPTVPVLLVVLVLGIWLKAAFVWLGMTQVGFTIARVTLELRLRLIRSLMRARWSYFVRQPLGSFANAVATEAKRSSVAYHEACQAAASMLQALAYFVVALLISWPVALAGVVAGVGFLYGLRGFVGMSRRAGNQMTSMMTSLTDRLTDTVHGIKALKAMGQEHRFSPILEDRTKGLEDAQRERIRAVEGMKVFQEPIIGVVVAVGMVSVINFSDIAFASLLVLIFIFYRLLRFANSLQLRMQAIVEGESAYWSLMKKIEEADAELEPRGATLSPPPLDSHIEFRDVHFSYGATEVLSGVSFRIEARSFVGILGESGSGKTTIVDILASILHPDAGEVLIDGVPLEDVSLAAWRQQIGYVPQEVLLMNDTVLNNVTLEDPTVSESQVRHALDQAGALDFVEALPEGLQSLTGEGGGGLSGGQRQRIGLARALVRAPKLLILDEATASLDQETAKSIVRRLKGLSTDMTIVSVSHQAEMVDFCDLRIHVSGGRATTGHMAEERPV